MSASTLLDRLDHVRRAGPSRWRARCPAHGGRNPASLSVRETDDGTILLRSGRMIAAQPPSSALSALGLHDLFPARDLPAGKHRRPPERRPWTAADALAAIAYEAGIVVVIAHDIAQGADITSGMRIRLLNAARRLAEVTEVARASD